MTRRGVISCARLASQVTNAKCTTCTTLYLSDARASSRSITLLFSAIKNTVRRGNWSVGTEWAVTRQA
jgi:hypothetical protein